MAAGSAGPRCGRSCMSRECMPPLPASFSVSRFRWQAGAATAVLAGQHFEHALRPVSAGSPCRCSPSYAAGVTFGGYHGLVTAL